MNLDQPTPLLVPGVTCWKTARAQKLSVIQDAGPTFAAMAAALDSARRTIFILGWDIDSRTPLRPSEGDAAPRAPRGGWPRHVEGNAKGGVPSGREIDGRAGTPLLPFLLGCLARQPDLEIFMLIWDFSIIYAFEREPRPRQQFGRVHPRLHFALDADHGSGGSHHQKIVVVDDEVAFVGGVDLTLHRWDSPDHRLHDRRRLDASGVEYEPFHDVHAAVSGQAAAALGELARARWRGGGRRRARVPPLAPGRTVSAWPRELTPDAVEVEVGFARTLTCAGEPPVREIAMLTLQMIATAARCIYAENQYLTSAAVVRALGERLGAADGPEIVLVLPAAESGWMEQGSMGLLRQEALAHLRRQDTGARLRLVSPVVSAGAESRAVAVHAKVLVVDDHILKVGSANFSNRSLGLDSECDLVVDARDQAGVAFVTAVRDRLLGEHLGLEASEVARRRAAGASLCALVDRQAPGAVRSLVPVPELSGAAFDFTVLDGAMVDPAEPWSVDGLLERAVPVPLRRRLTRRWPRPLLFAASVIGAWAILRRGPLRSVHLGGVVLDVASWLGAQQAGPFLAFAGVALASFLFVPITLLATATLTVFGVWPGVPIAWTGAVLGAALSHAVGARWGRRAIAWIPARLAATLRRSLGRRAFWSVILMRLLPVGNFGALNVLAGAFKIPRRSFILGNAVGLLPGMLGLGVLVNRALAALRHPSLANMGAVAAVAAAVTTLAIVARRRFGAPTMAASKDVT